MYIGCSGHATKVTQTYKVVHFLAKYALNICIANYVVLYQLLY